MSALPRASAWLEPPFEDSPKRFDLDFTSRRDARALSEATFDIVAVRRRVRHAGNQVVLVVDGDADSGERTAARLREAGYHAAVESAPREAARHMARLGAPALVLLEADLPQMSGLDFLERIRANRRLRDTPVVMFTARSRRGDLVRAFQSGADGYISKSVDTATFVTALGKLLGE